ncbi:hypothetical protein [Oligoflexus tunisiensis]|uniref:hypothetical protein n=1 Tax=Oligoflexus tunisiensis TaxID=708132 RepID=UPI00114CA02C|nr:hypothetical protein [Oligoflexus tunisiensis]
MHAIKMTLIMTLSLLTTQAVATIVPITDEVLEATFRSEGGSRYTEGYVKLNRTAGNIALLLQPATPPCPVDQLCTEVQPAPFEYFLEEVKSTVDVCESVIYQAEQHQDHAIKVTLIDNTHYNYEICPTFLPVPLTVVQVEQTFHGPASTEHIASDFAGEALSHIRY